MNTFTVSPPAPSDMLFVTSNGTLHALHKQCGYTIYTLQVPFAGFDAFGVHPHLSTGRLVLSHGGGGLRCVRATDGGVEWGVSVGGLGADVGVVLGGSVKQEGDDQEEEEEVVNVFEDGQEEEEDLVFVAKDAVVRALRLRDGSVVWEHVHANYLAKGSTYSSTPFLLLEGGILYVAGSGRVVALNVARGDQVWMADVDGGKGYAVLATMKSGLGGRRHQDVGASRQAVNLQDSKDSKTSHELEDALFVASNGRIVALSESTGLPLHIPRPSDGKITFPSAAQHPLTQSIPLTLTTTDANGTEATEALLVSSGDELRLVDLQTGLSIWESKMDALLSATSPNPGAVASILVGKARASSTSTTPTPNILFESHEPFLPAYSRTDTLSLLPPTSRKQQRIQNPLNISTTAFVASANKLFAIDIHTGSVLWTFTLGLFKGIELPTLLLQNGRVFMSGNKKVVCIDAQSGSVVWTAKIGGGSGRFVQLSSWMDGNGEGNRALVSLVMQKKVLDEERGRTLSAALA
ncbi:hypothetical protein HDV05_003875 [Chytridiales sp. JEL 0842]|nr:hypothetical protein HDV05_003875 [Chytridiales sp. JEL 0842]